MATHSSILAWKIPWSEEPGGAWRATVHGVIKSWTWLSEHTYIRFGGSNFLRKGILLLKKFSGVPASRLCNSHQYLTQQKCHPTSKKKKTQKQSIWSPYLYLHLQVHFKVWKKSKKNSERELKDIRHWRDAVLGQRHTEVLLDCVDEHLVSPEDWAGVLQHGQEELQGDHLGAQLVGPGEGNGKQGQRWEVKFRKGCFLRRSRSSISWEDFSEKPGSQESATAPKMSRKGGQLAWGGFLEPAGPGKTSASNCCFSLPLIKQEIQQEQNKCNRFWKAGSATNLIEPITSHPSCETKLSVPLYV